MTTIILRNSIRLTILLFAVSFVLTGCQSEAAKSEKPAEVKTYRKSGPVEISGVTAKTISPNLYSTVVLNFKLNSPRERVSVTLQPSQGLTIAGDLTSFDLAISAAGSEESRNLSVSAETEGLYHLNVFVETQRGDAKSVQTAAVPILVGTRSAKTYMQKNGAINKDADGRPIVSMPASEPKKTDPGKSQ
jgi:hypothetical protein